MEQFQSRNSITFPESFFFLFLHPYGGDLLSEFVVRSRMMRKWFFFLLPFIANRDATDPIILRHFGHLNSYALADLWINVSSTMVFSDGPETRQPMLIREGNLLLKSN